MFGVHVSWLHTSLGAWSTAAQRLKKKRKKKRKKKKRKKKKKNFSLHRICQILSVYCWMRMDGMNFWKSSPFIGSKNKNVSVKRLQSISAYNKIHQCVSRLQTFKSLLRPNDRGLQVTGEKCSSLTCPEGTWQLLHHFSSLFSTSIRATLHKLLRWSPYFFVAMRT